MKPAISTENPNSRRRSGKNSPYPLRAGPKATAVAKNPAKPSCLAVLVAFLLTSLYYTDLSIYEGYAKRTGLYNQGVENMKKNTQFKSPAAGRVLRTASELFYAEGIRAVGVDTIVERAGVAKMTLYKNFGSKDELVVAYLRARDERWRAWLEDALERRAASPKDKLLAAFDASSEWMERESPRGCAFINAFAEIADPTHPALEVAQEQKRWMLGYLTKLASGAGAGKPEELAERLFMLLEGATVTDAMRTIGNSMHKAKETAVVLVADL